MALTHTKLCWWNGSKSQRIIKGLKMCDNLSIMWLKIIKHVYVECDEHILYLDLYKKWCSFMNGNGESRRQMFPEIFFAIIWTVTKLSEIIKFAQKNRECDESCFKNFLISVPKSKNDRRRMKEKSIKQLIK